MTQHTPNYQSILNLEDLIEVNPPTVDCHLKVIDSIARMNQKNHQSSLRYNYILVIEDSKLVGILTERDIVKLTAAEIDLAKITVEEVMTTQLITLKKSDFANVYTVLTILRNNQIRHLPIVDAHGQLEGVISVESICRALHPSNLLKFRCVEEAMTTQILHAPMTTSVLSLSQMMADNRSSCVVITDEKLLKNNAESSSSLLIPIGIVTERDIVQFQILGLDLVNTIAQTVMSSPLVCMKPRDSLMEVRQQMEKLRVRRLVITGEQEELKGIITQLNMLKVLDPTELFGVIETLQEELDEKIYQLQKEKELAQVTLQSIGDAVITTDTLGKIVNFNPMAEKLTKWNSQEAKGRPLSRIFCTFDEHTRKPKPNLVEQFLQKNQDCGLVNHALLIARDDTEYIIEGSVAPICDRQEQIIGTVVIFRDVTESRALTHQLSWQATHDVLTGLCNRRQFEQKLTEALASAQEEACQHALCYLDLDRFKIVNDTCGHAAGDELLRQVSEIFRQQVRSSDIVARLGGDEFGLLLHQCPLSVAMKIADKLRQAIENFRFTWQGRTFSIGVSIGVIEITSITEDLTSLMSAADAACYAAKQKGRNCVHVYHHNDTELSQQLGEIQWITRLNQALKENHFCLYSQKIISLQDNAARNHYEILLRLCDQPGQLILPSAFIPTAERYNLMPTLDRWVINNFLAGYEKSCQKKTTQQSAQSQTLYFLNLSGESINSQKFRLFLQEKLTQARIPLTTICFEITETAAISNIPNAVAFMQELKKLGCSIALDDFGNGMSSLTYLKNLPVDYLKIDGSFVTNILRDRLDCVAVECLNRIGQAMNLKTVAEFVENEATLNKLQELGVDYAQGYGIARPEPMVFD